MPRLFKRRKYPIRGRRVRRYARAGYGPYRRMRYANPGRSLGLYGRYPKAPAIETHCVDFPRTVTSFNLAGLFSLLNGCVDGTSYYTRLGAQVQLSSLDVRYSIIPSNVNQAACYPFMCRIMIVYDRAPNGAFPTMADLLLDTNYAGATNTTPYSSLNPQKVNRFLILRDNQILLPQLGIGGVVANGPMCYQDVNTNASSPQGSINQHYHIKLKGLLSQYAGSSGGIGDLSVGALYLVAINEDTAVSPYMAWDIAFSSRCRFRG